ncbi:MAG: chromosome segregation protein SMC [Pirellulales bacterium]
MLKALELSGFKSFADRTRFDFPRGITVVVGPNGSGKSNIVDAVKWVLGEQSVKSLRGKEMVDVIFNGSGSRAPQHSAEATLVFDNASRLLAVDTPEVHITRRVYRSGEGEYLINGQPSRLRDIRELFAGTGIATEAYSVIEQGKVDVLLQSSPRDRRMIFEEAAGISRFKAKKVEAQRRLERVDQNLLRLSDIVQEVESRLRSVRQQAGKARRYRELSDRLRELRVALAAADWRQASSEIAALEAEIVAARGQHAAHTAQAERLEARALDLDIEAGEAERSARASEQRTAQHRERIAALETGIEHQRQRWQELDAEIAQRRRDLATFRLDAGDLAERLSSSAQGKAQAAQAAAEAERLAAAAEAALGEVMARLQSSRTREAAQRGQQVKLVRALAECKSALQALDTRLAALTAEAQARDARLVELESQAADAERTQSEWSGRTHSLRLEVAAAGEQRTAAKERGEHARAERTAAQAQLELLRGRRQEAQSRATVLEELERRLEGIGAGVKQLLLQARSDEPGPFAEVLGLVADLLRVNVEHATVLEVALGERAQHLVVRDGRSLRAHLQARPLEVEGRVGFVWLDQPAQTSPARDLRGQRGVLGGASDLVQSEHPALRMLLADVWVVEALADAQRLAAECAGGRFVTRGGELVESAGIWSLGPPHAGAGLISRRSELRVLWRQTAELAARIDEEERVVEQLIAQEDAAEAELRSAAEAARDATEALGLAQLQAEIAERRFQDVTRQIASAREAHAASERERAALSARQGASREQHAQCQQELALVEGQLEAAVAEIAQLEPGLRETQAALTAARVQAAQAALQLDDWTARVAQLELDRDQREQAAREGWRVIDDRFAKQQAAQRAILAAESELAQLFLRKETFVRETRGWTETRDAQRSERQELVEEARQARAAARRSEEAAHAHELSAGEFRLQRTSLADRLREDYGLELAEVAETPRPFVEDRAAADQEVADLRRKLNSLGGVNVDALAELDELEARHAQLSSQHADLTAAKQALDQIIGRINADSRRLFAATLDTVKGHFEELFRKLFGGGAADIVLEEGVDILESGIEIVARPPGKEPRSISLLSGGEKTLTCVALLLAIFRSRPSPFCILDEVDAALDEANIDRFVSVLQDFLAWTQFVVVTHSKKTMTCAHTLYGVTMQESGVSKRVSVRFEDEQGHALSARGRDDSEAA